MVSNALDESDVVRPIIRGNGSLLQIAGIVKQNDSTGLIEMKAFVDTVKNKIMEDDVTCESEVHFCENVARQVLAIANDKKPDLIVITATLDSSIWDFFLGPYTQDIVNHAAFPRTKHSPRTNKTHSEYFTRIVARLLN